MKLNAVQKKMIQALIIEITLLGGKSGKDCKNN